MCSAERARRTSCHPGLVPLRCCLRLCEITPVPLPQVLPLLAQCGLGALVLSTSKSAALYKSLHALLFRDIELPVFIIPSGFASEAVLKVPNTRLCRWRTAICSRSVRPMRQAGVSASASPSLQEPCREPRPRRHRLETGTLEVQPGN